MNTITTTMTVEQNRCYSMLASLLEYPNDALLNTCDTLVSEVNSGVAEPLRIFRDYAATHPLSRIQEIYTGTFDLMASCSPYLGIHIFGEDNYKRGALMASMNTEMQNKKFDTKNELPDHVGVVLRFLPMMSDAEQKELYEYCLKPSLRSMVALLENNPYQHLINAAVTLLELEYSIVGEYQ